MSMPINRPKTQDGMLLSMPSGAIMWHFPPTGGGISQGFNDSGQEFFKANIMEHMVREIIQNSLDAKDHRRSEAPVIVRMKQVELTPEMIGANSLMPHVQRSMERMNDSRQIPGARFYKKALGMMKKGPIPSLAITDENTTGLTDPKWDALVYKEGTPNKDGQMAAGGSFGIGKNAPYAASRLGLVCYSTRYLNKHRTEKFIARCKLVAHPDPAKPEDELQHVGFGNSEPLRNSRFPPIMGQDINETFRLKRSGSGIFIVGFVEPDWEESAKRSTACNFFAAIHEKKLKVVINGTAITHETLNSLDFGGGSYRNYYEILKRGGRPFKIRGRLGTFELKVKTDNEDMENKVAYVNRRGMLITDEKTFKRNPFHPRLGGIGKFVAVIRAADDKTDVRVRKMEPPTHEAIEFERISDKSDRISMEKMLNEIKGKVADHIKEKLHVDSLEKKTQLTELADILPFFSDLGKDKRRDRSYTEPKETVEHRQLPIPNSKPSTLGHDPGESGDGGRESGSGKDGSGGVSKAGGESKDPKKVATVSAMNAVRVVRHGDVLRVAFTSKSRHVVFAVKPAGEESKPEDVVLVTSVESASPDGKPTLSDNTITVKTKQHRRVILDLSVSQSESYTGYDLVEYEAGGKKT